MATHGAIPANKDIGTNLAAVGALTVASGPALLLGAADAASAQTAITALQAKLDALIAIVNAMRNV